MKAALTKPGYSEGSTCGRGGEMAKKGAVLSKASRSGKSRVAKNKRAATVAGAKVVKTRAAVSGTKRTSK